VSFGCEAIEASFAIVLGCAVFRCDEAVFDEPLESGIERTMANLEHFARAAFNGFRNCVTMHGTKGNRLQNEQIERALKEAGLVVRASSRHST
jgi:hypothetical protein